jgi:hypothetical protein
MIQGYVKYVSPTVLSFPTPSDALVALLANSNIALLANGNTALLSN